jgi:hypothetical protein
VEEEHVQKFGIARKYLGKSFEISRYLNQKKFMMMGNRLNWLRKNLIRLLW